MPTDYRALASDLTSLIGKLGVSKSEIKTVVDSGSNPGAATNAVTVALEAVKKLSEAIAHAEVTPAERDRKIKELQSEVELLRIILATEHDLEARIIAQREIGRLSARLGVYMSQNALRFDDLIDHDKNEIGLFLEEARRDVAARENLRRVLKGVEVALRIGAFSATLAAKLATGL
jgi:hypothetical protein